MENKLNALNAMYDYAVSHNLCSNKIGFANLLNAANSNLSKAFNGDPRYLTDKFIKRVNSALGGIFNEMWLLYGEGDMLIAGRDVYGTNTGQIRGDKQTAQDNAAPVFQNTGKGGNNVTQGAPASTIDKLIEEMRAQRESSDKQIDRLLTIIETITNTSK